MHNSGMGSLNVERAGWRDNHAARSAGACGFSPEQIHDRRLKELLKLAQDWVAQEHLILPDIEYVLHEAGKRLHRDRAMVMRLPCRTETPSELLTLVQPQRVPEDYMPARLEYCVDWLVRWLASCLPREEGLRDELLRSLATWARG